MATKARQSIPQGIIILTALILPELGQILTCPQDMVRFCPQRQDSLGT